MIPLLMVMVLLTGCAAPVQTETKKQYTATFLTLFDTVTTIVGYAQTEEEFQKTTSSIHDELEVYRSEEHHGHRYGCDEQA